MAKQQNIPGGLEGLAALNLGNEKITLDEEKAKNMEMQQNQPTEKAAPNLGWLFYYDYFRGLDVERNAAGKFIGKLDGDPNRPLFAANLNDYKPFSKELFPLLGKAEHGFRLKTTYPGLLIGSGYQHETGAESELKLGFFFDHTSGLPVIPGSSVKGVLRSVFHKNQRPFMVAFIKDLFNEVISETQVEEMTTEIFGPAPKKHLPAGQSASPMSRDVFFDAVPEKSNHKNLPPANGNLLANDFITPHHPGDPLGAFKDPVPIQFLKVLPEVVFRFQFDLKPSKNFSFLDVEAKKKLFQEILLTLGLGAKTNVSYGQFTEVKP